MLLIVTIVYVMIRRFLPALGPIPISNISITVLALLMGTASFLVRTRYPVDQGLAFPTIQPAHASQYVCLFAVGIWASGSDLAERTTPELTCYWRRVMMMACVPAVVSFMSVDVPGNGMTNLEPLFGGWTWQSLVTSLWEQIGAVGLITNLLSLFGTRCREAGPIMSSAEGRRARGGGG